MRQGKTNRVIEGKQKGEPNVVRGSYVRMKVWNALVGSDKPLQPMEVKELSGCTYDQVKSWLDAWAEFGYVKKEMLEKSPTGGKRFNYTPNEKTAHPPAITLKGKPSPTEHRQLLWEAMRDAYDNSETFYAADLIEAIKDKHGVEVNYTYAMSYLYDISLAHYLVLEAVTGRDPLYRLKYNTGALAPSLCRGKRVFDANLGVMVS